MATENQEIIGAERLVRLEEKQKAMAFHVAELKSALETNTIMTAQIKQTLDELTGAKKLLIGFTGAFIGAATSIATYLGIHHR